ncbi:hypothetical protein ACFQDN_22315 [Pseudomonas asuensis]
MSWLGVQNLGSRKFTCGHCGNIVASSAGYTRNGSNQRIYICSHCGQPTHFDVNYQYPDIAPGNDVQHLPEDIEGLYKEARNCVAASSYTGSVLISRKLLMNIAVREGAEEGKPFIYYVTYLADKGYVPPNGRGWVDHIRKKKETKPLMKSLQ